MKIIAMIPARYGASRFPAKLMQDLGGETVIYRTYQATLNTELFDARGKFYALCFTPMKEKH